jgi:DNA (cytosine-5)-methyltransferase 1
MRAINSSSPEKSGPGRTTTVVDLFCGAGGLGLGFLKHGFKIIWAADMLPPAVETYRKNIGDHIEEMKIDWSTIIPEFDVIIKTR